MSNTEKRRANQIWSKKKEEHNKNKSGNKCRLQRQGSISMEQKLILRKNQQNWWAFIRLKNKEQILIIRIRNERKVITTNLTKIKRIINQNYEQFYPNKLDKLDEIDNFLEHKPP